jgi:hypothetical protein
MGTPSAAFWQSSTDKLAARFRQALNALPNEYLGSTTADLWDLLDAEGDPDLVAALITSFVACDRQSMPENMQTALSSLMTRGSFKNVASALLSYLRSSAGGATTLAAFLAASGATTHPLAAEIIRTVQGGADPFLSGGAPISVFPPNYIAPFPDHVYMGTDAAQVDKTSQAANSPPADLPLFAANGDALYVGSRYQFTGMVAALSTLASATITPSVKYWNGSAWAAVSGLSDQSVGFTKNERITWTLPADWERSNKDASGAALGAKERLYYIRISRGNAAGITTPVGTCITLFGSPVLQGTTKHLGVDQPLPLAICRITAANTMAIEVLTAPDRTRFTAPAIRLRALTPIGADLTFTISYTDQGGTNRTQAQSSWTAPAALGTKAVNLGAGTGVNAILPTGWGVATTATEGIFAVEVVEARTPAV